MQLIRSARPADAPAMAAIYALYVRDTAITFRTDPLPVAAYTELICQDQYPCFVSEEAGRVTGFIHAGALRPHQAYRWDVELTVYLLPDQVGKGVGHDLMAACLDALTAQGFLSAYSCVTVPNPRSVHLHERFGFERVGYFPAAGYKLGAWHDVVWLRKALADHTGQPAETLPFSSVRSAWER